MEPKQHRVSGRIRTTPRPGRHASSATERQDAHMARALHVARRFVAARWPELSGVTPVARCNQRYAPSPRLLARLGLSGAEVASAPAEGAYTFTFCGEQHTVDGAATPLVANVTVDAHLHIVKTSVSR